MSIGADSTSTKEAGVMVCLVCTTGTMTYLLDDRQYGTHSADADTRECLYATGDGRRTGMMCNFLLQADCRSAGRQRERVSRLAVRESRK